MTDPAKVIRLEPEVQRHIRARMARLSAGVHAYNEAGKKRLGQLLVTFFDSADDTLFELADVAQSNQEQNLFFDSMREVRVQRKGLESRYLDTIVEAFARLVGEDERDALKNSGELSPDALSLVQNEDLEQLVAVEATIIRANKEYSAHLYPLCKQLTAAVPTTVEEHNYPFGPQVLCTAMMAQIKRLDIDIKAKMALFKLFDQLVIGQLNGLYELLLDLLTLDGTGGSASSSERAAPAMSNRSYKSTENEPYAIAPGLMEALAFAQKLPLGSDPDGPIDLLRVIESVQKHRANSIELSRIEQESIQLVQKMFRFIMKDHTLAAPLRILLCQLQVPVVKTALLDPSFLRDKRHPARALLNEFVGIALEWGSGAEVGVDDALFTVLKSTVERVCAANAPQSETYQGALADLTSYLESEKRRAAVLEKRTVDAEGGKARAELARKTVATEVASRLAATSASVPTVVQALIDGPWSNVLFVTGLKYGFQSSEWDEQTKVLSDLLWSVQPTFDQRERQKLIRLIPDLIQRIRRGLDSVSFNPFEVSELLGGLEDIHVSRIRGDFDHQQSATEAAKEPQGYSESSEAADSKLANQPAAGHSSSAEIDNADQDNMEASSDTAANPADLAPDDPYMIAVRGFAQGAWFDLDSESEEGEVLRCRLAAFIKPTQKYIFVNRSGSKVAEKSQQELAIALRDQKLRTVDNSMLFDKALESVVSGLRKSQSGLPLDFK